MIYYSGGQVAVYIKPLNQWVLMVDVKDLVLSPLIAGRYRRPIVCDLSPLYVCKCFHIISLLKHPLHLVKSLPNFTTHPITGFISMGNICTLDLGTASLVLKIYFAYESNQVFNVIIKVVKMCTINAVNHQ